MKLIHVELKDANAFVEALHRHHKPVVGHRFSLGAVDKTGKVIGVSIVGRPVARAVDHRSTVEVLRLCTDGTKNACSFLYSASARAAKALGYEKIQTYILEEESGVSLRAAGWEKEGMTKRDTWNTPIRGGRRTDQPNGRKQRWSKILS